VVKLDNIKQFPSSNVFPWRAQPGPQLEAIRHHTIDELFYGGAVGGGKSDFLLGDFAQDVPQEWGPHWHGILFRKSYPELEEIISRSKEIYPPWFPGVKWLESDKTWVWPNGATLKLRFIETANDWMKYWGHQYTWIGWDELPTWPDMSAYVKMKVRLRSAHHVPNKRIRATGNPGGASHAAVKSYFKIDQFPMGSHIFEAGGTKRMFIRSRLFDNQILLKNDPKYVDRLRGLGSETLVAAWLDGDWSVVEGAYFPEFTTDRHVIEPFAIPEHWAKFRAMDWGSARPFAVNWYAVSAGDVEGINKGCLVQYREWYGIRHDQNGQIEPNVGLKLTAEEVAAGIREREGRNETLMGVLDPAAFSEDGGPSIASRMARAPNFVVFTRADNKRVAARGAMGGWDQLRARLKGEDGRPMLLFFKTCQHTIRTLPALQHDKLKPEDVDSDGEDHSPDAVRYACMSRPYVAPLPTSKEPPRGARTIEEMVRRYEARISDVERI